MNVRTHLIRLGALIAPMLVALALGGPSVLAAPEMASNTVVVATTLSPSNCGKYTSADYTNLTAAAAGRTTGTILVCPGVYATLPGTVIISNANKLTIKAAITGPGSRPYLKTGAASTVGIYANNSLNLTIDGLIIDVSASTNPIGIQYYGVSGAIRNTTVIGATTSPFGIRLDNGGLEKGRNMVLTNSQVLGFVNWGVFFAGQGKLTMTGNLVDGSDGGRVSGAPEGVLIQGATGDIPGPTAVISRNIIQHNNTGIFITSADKVTVSGNTISDHSYGVTLEAYGVGESSNNTKITKNTITGVAYMGIEINNSDAANATILKTTISGNLISASPYKATGSSPFGVYVTSDLSTPARTTASISKNTFIGFPITPGPLFIVFNPAQADITIGSNIRTP